MYNKSIFNKELSMITNEEYRKFISKCLDNVPTYFWRIPASSSGKYHPKADLGEGGLVRHTKACVQVGLDLLQSEEFLYDDTENRDIIIGALLLHDCIKNGFENSGHTEFLHPQYAYEFITDIFNDEVYDEEVVSYAHLVRMCIKSHMGKWNTNKYSDDVLPTPTDDFQKLVHMADYIASRKWCNMNEINLFDKE